MPTIVYFIHLDLDGGGTGTARVDKDNAYLDLLSLVWLGRVHYTFQTAPTIRLRERRETDKKTVLRGSQSVRNRIITNGIS